MYKLGLEKAEESEIKLPAFNGLQRKQGNSVSLTTLNPFIMWIIANYGKFLEVGILDHLTCLLSNLYAGQEAAIRTGQGTADYRLVQN